MDFRWKKISAFARKIAPVILILVFVVSIFTLFVTDTNAQAPANSREAGNNEELDSKYQPFGFLTDLALSVPIKVLNWLLHILTWFVSVILSFSGFVLDLSIKYAVSDFHRFVGDGSIVSIGWVIFRDLSNLVFIFLILWVAISTILGLHSGSAMGSVMRIVIAALLINFSLFITKAVIDVSNVFALHFWNLITVDGTGSFSGVFMQGLGLSNFYSNALNLGSGPVGLGATTVETKFMITFIFAIITMLVTSWIFLSGAVLFLIRILYLIILMIFAPFAFIAWVIPGMGGITQDWWKRLFRQAFFAPIFLVIVYVIAKAIESDALVFLKGNKNWSGMVEYFIEPTRAGNNDLSVVGIAINFGLIIGLLIAALTSANKLGAVGATKMISWGEKLRGAGQSFVGRNSVGRMAEWAERKYGSSYLANTSVGHKVREFTTIPLANTKFGGSMSAIERRKESKKLEYKRADAERIDKVKDLIKNPNATREEQERAMADISDEGFIHALESFDHGSEEQKKFLRLANVSQLNSLHKNDELYSEEEKKEFFRMKYGHINDEGEKYQKAMQDYNSAMENWVIQNKPQNEWDFNGVRMNGQPKKPSPPQTYKEMRAMSLADWEYMNFSFPNFFRNPYPVSIIRQGDIDRIRNNPKFPPTQADNIRRRKAIGLTDSRDLYDGISLAPTKEFIQQNKSLGDEGIKEHYYLFREEMRSFIKGLREAGISDDDIVLGDLSLSEFAGTLGEKTSAFSAKLHSILKKYNIDDTDGKLLGHTRVKRDALRQLSAERAGEAFGGKTPEEIIKAPFSVLSHPILIKTMGSGSMGYMSGRDQGDQKIVLEVVLNDLLKELRGKKGALSDANKSIIKWLATDQAGKGPQFYSTGEMGLSPDGKEIPVKIPEMGLDFKNLREFFDWVKNNYSESVAPAIGLGSKKQNPP